jgi:hypothetical protein
VPDRLTKSWGGVRGAKSLSRRGLVAGSAGWVMPSSTPWRWVGLALAAGSVSCIGPTLILGTGEGGDATSLTGADDDSDGSDGPPGDVPWFPPCDPDSGCKNKIDLLFVIDNSGTMGEEQLNLARNFPRLIEELEDLTDRQGHPVGPDVNVMVTTTDVGANPSCHTMDEKPGYVAARGAPIYTPCTERLERFTGRGDDAPVFEDACTEVCDPDAPISPTDQFLHFSPQSANVPAYGTPAEALACIGPQGIDGCGYEAPLEAMAQALNPTACWNDPEHCNDPELDWMELPFLRDDAVLAIAIITDETDCSVRDFSIMESLVFKEFDPLVGLPTASSAICWNAGVMCTGFDASTRIYDQCVSVNKDVDGNMGVSDDEAVLHPVSRYLDLLHAYEAQGRDVIMLGVLGVPPVTEHADLPPYHPIAGGVDDLVYRQWNDPQYPDGDILPDEWDAGVRAIEKEWEFGMGPGCTGSPDGGVTFTGQAIPPVRIQTVCEALNVADDPTTVLNEGRVRCCIESICGSDYSPALTCLTGLIKDAFTPVG